MAKKNQQRRNRRSGIVFSWYWLLLAFGAMLVFLFLGYRPELQPMRDTLAYQAVMKMIPTGVLLYFAWVAKSRPPRLGQIIMTLMACILWQGLLIPSERLVLLNATVLTFVGIGYLLYLNVMLDKNNKPLCWATVFQSLVLLLQMRYYTYLDGKMHYWIFGLVLALLAGIVACYLIHRGLRWMLDEDTILERICVCFIVSFAVFVLSWSTANNMNCFLDFSEPEEYCMSIVHKQTRSSRAGTYYEVVLEHNEKEITMEVSQSTYYQYEIGDNFPVELYQGFFKDPYFIAKGTA